MQCKISIVNGKKTLVPLEMEWNYPAQMCSCSVVQYGSEYLVRTATGAAFTLQPKYLQTFVR